MNKEKLSYIGNSALDRAVGVFNWENPDQFNKEYNKSIKWAIRCYNEGVNLKSNYSNLKRKDEYFEPSDSAYEVAQDLSSLNDFQVRNLFYYLDIGKNMNDWIEDFIGNGEQDDIQDIMRWGVFGMALYLINDGYDNREEGEA